jgi:hypothetical protein
MSLSNNANYGDRYNNVNQSHLCNSVIKYAIEADMDMLVWCSLLALMWKERPQILSFYSAFNVQLKLSTSHCCEYFKRSLHAATASTNISTVLRAWQCNKGNLLRSTFIWILFCFCGQQLHSVSARKESVKYSCTGKPNVCRTAATVVPNYIVNGLSWTLNPLYQRLLTCGPRTPGDPWRLLRVSASVYIRVLTTSWPRLCLSTRRIYL